MKRKMLFIAMLLPLAAWAQDGTAVATEPWSATDITAIVTAIGVLIAAIGRIIAAIKGGTSITKGLIGGTNTPPEEDAKP